MKSAHERNDIYLLLSMKIIDDFNEQRRYMIENMSRDGDVH